MIAATKQELGVVPGCRGCCSLEFSWHGHCIQAIRMNDMFASRAGLALLLELKAKGAVLSGCSPFLSGALMAADA
jgi:hypothetical protein